MSGATTNFVQTLSEGIHVKRPANDLKAVESFTFVGETAIASQLGVASHLALGLKQGANNLMVTDASRAVLEEALDDFIRSRATQCEVIRLRREVKAESTQTWTAASTANVGEVAFSFNDRPAAPAPKKRKPKPKSRSGSSRRQRAANDR